MKIVWHKCKEKMPPNDFDYDCHIRWTDDNFESRSDGGTIWDTYIHSKIEWGEITDGESDEEEWTGDYIDG